MRLMLVSYLLASDGLIRRHERAYCKCLNVYRTIFYFEVEQYLDNLI